MTEDLLSDFQTINSALSGLTNFGGAWLDEHDPSTIFVNLVKTPTIQSLANVLPLSSHIVYNWVGHSLSLLDELLAQLTSDITAHRNPAQYIAAVSISVRENVVVINVASGAPDYAEKLLIDRYPYSYLRIASRIRIT